MAHDIIIGRWIDPLGRTILLTSSQWRNHILVRHAEMAVMLEAVGKVIEDPEIIFKQGNVRIYCHRVSEQRYLRVIVAFESDRGGHEGWIITAYKTRKLKEEGFLEWPKI